MDKENYDRPFTKVVLAMSADGKIADANRSPARFGSAADKLHLETQIASCDAVLLGAKTLRAYGTTLRVTSSNLLHQRQEEGKPPQPIQIVCSASGDIDPSMRFFQQPIPRWLLTTTAGATQWYQQDVFEQVLVENSTTGIEWAKMLARLKSFGIRHLAVLGGGELVASLLAAGCLDELCLTICPLLLGGHNAPTPVAGDGFLEALAPRLELASVRSLDHEVFLSYRVRRL